MFTALLGVLLGTASFAGFFWSVAQAFRQSGPLAWTHAVLAALTLLGMSSISLDWSNAALPIGITLTLAALIAIVIEQGWNRLLPLSQLGFGIALGLGLPFL